LPHSCYLNKAVSITIVTNEVGELGTKDVNMNGGRGGERMDVKMDAAGIREMKRMYLVLW